MMHRSVLSIEAFPAWTTLNQVRLEGIAVADIPRKGHGLVATASRNDLEPLLMAVPKDLILSLENVWILAKADRHLRDVLHAMGDYARTARGAILVFLLVQLTHTVPTDSARVGMSCQFTQYVQMLPSEFKIPTFWSDYERSNIRGTSLEAALEAKLVSLDREFTELRNATSSISWCREVWWTEGRACLTFTEWKVVDAMYRSRALDLPGTGHALVPGIDLANHSSGDATIALYDTDVDGNAILVLRDGRKLEPGEEVTITYGDEKGACEMLFSYGFLEQDMTSARELFLDIEIGNDDPLKYAKKAVSKSAPGIRIFGHHGTVGWEGAFVWLLCINEEDGLQFVVFEANDGSKELKVFWNSEELSDLSNIEVLLREHPQWIIFELRALVVVRDRVRHQLQVLSSQDGPANPIDEISGPPRATVEYARKLRELEESMLLQAQQVFEDKISNELVPSDIVQRYLGLQAPDNQTVDDDDFS